METRYLIQWKSKANGRAGKGTKRFTLQEAESLANELNRQFPHIQHKPMPAEPELDNIRRLNVVLDSEPELEEAA
jgi:hypothetical protein